MKLYESLAAGAGYRVGKSLTGGGFNAKMSRLMMTMVMTMMRTMMRTMRRRRRIRMAMITSHNMT